MAKPAEGGFDAMAPANVSPLVVWLGRRRVRRRHRPGLRGRGRQDQRRRRLAARPARSTTAAAGSPTSSGRWSRDLLGRGARRPRPSTAPGCRQLSDAEFRPSRADWLAEHLTGEFAALRGSRRSRPRARARRAAAGVGARARRRPAGSASAGPMPHGGAGAEHRRSRSIFYEEYARAGGPGRLGHIGEYLLGADPDRVRHRRSSRQRFLPADRGRRASSGARATPSPTPAPTSPTCGPAPCSTATCG